jgi:hypothetical protein
LSDLESSVVFSAGLNPSVFAYLATFPDFFPDENGRLRKQVILKVSDHRSAILQGRYLAKRGIWVSEFRIESGLNCGGHAFPTNGYLLGPVLEEFKRERAAMAKELFETCVKALHEQGRPAFTGCPGFRISVQGGIGTSAEDAMLREKYGMDATGWGSPFLLVPEATNVDDETLNKLATAQQEDYFLSRSSPLGVMLNNFRGSSSEVQRKKRIDAGRPGSPCYLKHLAFNTEFTTEPICVASRQYQHLKLKQLESMDLPQHELNEKRAEVLAKDCLCEGLSSGALVQNHIRHPHKLYAVAVCPGPNLAYFSGVFTLRQMLDHIYGRDRILNEINRPHMFMNELKMYLKHFMDEVKATVADASDKHKRNLRTYRDNLLQGIIYYRDQISILAGSDGVTSDRLSRELQQFKIEVMSVLIGDEAVVVA